MDAIKILLSENEWNLIRSILPDSSEFNHEELENNGLNKSGWEALLLKIPGDTVVIADEHGTQIMHDLKPIKKKIKDTISIF